MLNSQLPPLPLILVAAVAAALGRLLLALAFRLLGKRLPAKYRRNLEAARAALEKNRRNAILALGLFALVAGAVGAIVRGGGPCRRPPAPAQTVEHSLCL